MTTLITRKKWRCTGADIRFATMADHVLNTTVLTAATVVMAMQTTSNQTSGKKTCQYKYAIEHLTHSNETCSVRSKRAFRNLIGRIWFHRKLGLVNFNGYAKFSDNTDFSWGFDILWNPDKQIKSGTICCYRIQTQPRGPYVNERCNPVSSIVRD